MNHQVNHGKLDHSFTAIGERLIVFTQAAILSQPRKRPFDHPASGQHRKTFNVLTTFDNLQDPAAKIRSPVNELACVSTIGPDQRQPTETTHQFPQNQLSTVTILNTGCVHNHSHHQTQRINHQMAFSTRYFLAGVIASIPPFEAVLTDWLSIIAALGLAWRPAWTRTRSWSVS